MMAPVWNNALFSLALAAAGHHCIFSTSMEINVHANSYLWKAELG